MTVEDVYSAQFGSFQLNLNQLTENIYIDPTNNTIREVGAFSYSPSAPFITLSKTNLANISSKLTVYLAPAGGTLPFDTGPQNLTEVSAGQYSFNGVIGSLGAFKGSYSMTTGGQTNSGSFNYSLNAFFVPNFNGYDGLLTTDYPESITLNSVGNQSGYLTPSPWPFEIFITANNGVQWELELGSSYWNSELLTVPLPASKVVVRPPGVSLGFCPALTISGVSGYSYVIQSTTNLMATNAWVTLTNLTLTQPVQLWVDTTVDASSPFYSKYFYRVLPGQ